MGNFTSTTTWKHLKTSPTHIRLHTRKTCVSWMKSIADRSFSLLSSGKVDTSLCSYCENVSCSCRCFAAFCFAVFLFIPLEKWCFLVWWKSCLACRKQQLCLLYFATCDLAIVQGEPCRIKNRAFYSPAPVIFLHKLLPIKLHAHSMGGETIHAHKNSPPPPPTP